MRQKKLYVWHDVLSDYTSGVMFALAYSIQEARMAILKENSSCTLKRDLMQEPKVYRKTVGFAVWGGG